MEEARWWSALETASAIRSGQVTDVEVLDAAIQRIETLDPALNAVVIKLFERARQHLSDRAGQRTPLDDSPFRGVPFLLKDAGEEIEGTSNWTGVQGLRRIDYRSRETTNLARKFESLGFATVGKSACPELSASSTTEPAGFEPTRNPWNTARTAGGSSGGAAAAVAAGLVPIAHGSDATGSLRFPASHCGVVTLKPSRGRIPLETTPTGTSDPLRIWTQFALARDANDLRRLFDELCDGPKKDHEPKAGHEAKNGTVPRGPRALPLRIGLLDQDPILGLPVASACKEAVQSVGRTLEHLGHFVEPGFPIALRSVFPPFWEAMKVIDPANRWDQVSWVAKRLGHPCTPSDVSEGVLALADLGSSLDPIAVAGAWEQVRKAMDDIPRWWHEGWDLLLTPVTLEPAWLIGETAPIRTGMFCAPFSFTGQPALVVPSGIVHEGTPVGIQIVGRFGADEALLDLAVNLQEAIGWLRRDPPTHH